MSRKYRSLIVDDEKLARDRLRKLLLKHEDRIDVIGEAGDGEEALVAAESLRPDIIFLDIQMPVLNGFEMLQQLSFEPRIIFTTAYDQYAIKAFEENSVDYLLKPIEEGRLDRCIRKLEVLEKASESIQLQQLMERLGSDRPKTLTVSLGDRMILVPVSDIVCMHAEDKYVFIFTKDGHKHLLSSSLKTLEQTLGSPFVRIHRAYIINRDYVSEIRRAVNGKLTFHMKGTLQITSGQSYTPRLRKVFGL